MYLATRGKPLLRRLGGDSDMYVIFVPFPSALIDWVSPIDLSVNDRTQSLVHVTIFFGFYFGHLDILCAATHVVEGGTFPSYHTQSL